ncbi:MAG TPA: hypothetical protein VEY67_05835 [Candidatus Dormibacteraeota bacterium]|nr:hypothetical protein [Candidatus Dormibacteraeota bacterium]
MTRVLDRGAIVAGWVGVGVAATVAISFLLVIPIEPIYWLLAFPVGLLVGYYADQRSDRRAGPAARILANALWAGLVTALVYAALLLAIKGIFFVADDGYRDVSAGGRITCTAGADCVYRRYLADGRDAQLRATGVTDVGTFTTFYWDQQLQTAGLLVAVVIVGSLGGGGLYWVFRPKPGAGGAVRNAEGRGAA